MLAKKNNPVVAMLKKNGAIIRKINQHIMDINYIITFAKILNL